MTKLGHAQYPLHEENHSIPEERFFTSQQAGRTTDFSEAKIANDPNGFRNWKAVLFHARRPRRLQADREKIPRGKRPRRAPGREPSPTSRAPLNRAINVSHRVINITRVLQFTRSQRVNHSPLGASAFKVTPTTPGYSARFFSRRFQFQSRNARDVKLRSLEARL